MRKTRSQSTDFDTTQALPRTFIYTILILGVFAIFTIITVFSIGVYDLKLAKKFAPLSSFANGILTPLFAFLSFIAILTTLVLQKIEMIAARQEFRRSADALEVQSFESAFFQMLEFHNSIVTSIVNDKYTGRVCFEYYYRLLKSIYKSGNYKENRIDLTEEEQAKYAYHAFYEQQQLEIGHYFRFLYNFLRIIDEKSDTHSNHIKLLRAQLSNQELVIIYYNCISDLGVNFKYLAAKHNLFDNMPEELLLDPSHINLIPKRIKPKRVKGTS